MLYTEPLRLRNRLRRILRRATGRPESPTFEIRDPDPDVGLRQTTWPNRGLCVLTPSPSQEDLVATSTSLSPFFTCLPSEIRRMVYLNAFGNHLIHMRFSAERIVPPPGSDHLPASRTTIGGNLYKWRSSAYHRIPREDLLPDDCCVWDQPVFPLGLGVIGWISSCRRV